MRGLFLQQGRRQTERHRDQNDRKQERSAWRPHHRQQAPGVRPDDQAKIVGIIEKGLQGRDKLPHARADQEA